MCQIFKKFLFIKLFFMSIRISFLVVLFIIVLIIRWIIWNQVSCTTVDWNTGIGSCSVYTLRQMFIISVLICSIGLCSSFTFTFLFCKKSYFSFHKQFSFDTVLFFWFNPNHILNNDIYIFNFIISTSTTILRIVIIVFFFWTNR